jgi:hypothetical protein
MLGIDVPSRVRGDLEGFLRKPLSKLVKDDREFAQDIRSFYAENADFKTLYDRLIDEDNPAMLEAMVEPHTGGLVPNAGGIKRSLKTFAETAQENPDNLKHLAEGVSRDDPAVLNHLRTLSTHFGVKDPDANVMRHRQTMTRVLFPKNEGAAEPGQSADELERALWEAGEHAEDLGEASIQEKAYEVIDNIQQFLADQDILPAQITGMVNGLLDMLKGLVEEFAPFIEKIGESLGLFQDEHGNDDVQPESEPGPQPQAEPRPEEAPAVGAEPVPAMGR